MQPIDVDMQLSKVEMRDNNDNVQLIYVYMHLIMLFVVSYHKRLLYKTKREAIDII